MSANRSNAVLSSSEKKRLRDRRAQATLREKRQMRIQELEDRVAFCEHNHVTEIDPQSAYVRDLLSTVERLRIENNRLRERQERLQLMVTSWDTMDEDETIKNYQISEAQRRGSNNYPYAQSHGSINSNNATAITTPTTSDNLNTTTTPTTTTEMPFRRALSPSPFPGAASPLATPGMGPIPHSVTKLASSRESLPPEAPAWCRVPLNRFNTNNSAMFPLLTLQRWFDRPDLIAACPVQPSPLDILYGSRHNYLAQKINQVVRRRAMRDAECLALGYLVYNWSKWRASPTPATFARLAPFQHPTQIQLEEDHLAGLDMVIWPRLRENVIQNWQKHDLVELVGYMSCCMKVRWPWGKDLLERDADDNLQLRSDFQKVFSDVDGWGLTAEFIDRYPMLLEGMDVEALRFEITLPSDMYAY